MKMKSKIKSTLALIISAALALTGCSSSEPDVILPDEPSTSTPFEETDITEITSGITSAVTAAVSVTEQWAASESKEAEVSDTEKAQTSDKQPGGGSGGGSGGNSDGGSGNNSGSGQGGNSGGSSNGSSGGSGSGSGSGNNSGGGSFEAGWLNGNTWESGGKYCGTIELKITNKTGSALSGWTVSFTVPGGFEIVNGWNGKYSVSGTTVTVKNESYNGDLANGASVQTGFQYSCSSKFTPPSNITINGNPAGSGSGGGNNGGGNGNPPSVAEKPAEPLPAPAVIGLVKEHGRLSVKGTQLVDKNGNNFQLKGMSTHGIAWFPDFINEGAFKTLRDDWNTNVVRLAMYTAEYGGYCSGGDKAYLKGLIDKGVQTATKLGMYVIIDWHILSDGNPQTNKGEAKIFFDEMSSKYKNYDNVLYEICNEPNSGTSWSTIKSYAEEMIPVIRKNSPDSVVIVGTPTWSQDIDQAESNRLKEKNVMYALHFYAATHKDWLRQRVSDCYKKGLPLFVTEFGCCDASGSGGNDFNETKQWLKLLDSCGISYCNWNLANKNESSSAFKESASTNGNWKESDMSESGKWIRKWFRGEIS